ncbi:MAG: hypothetical protein HZB61_03265 [Nitrospirae bacterium]|nr:hypothetical protein [Nitrospirota bacterium]
MKSNKWFTKYLSSTVFAAIFLLTANILHAAGQSSAHYQIPTDVISGGGGGGGSANYTVGHTTGQSTAIGESASANYKNQAGFWYTFLGIPSGDTDGDGIPDGDGTNPCTGGNAVGCDDNCINTSNADQADADSDGAGDLCDNCRLVSNPDQMDGNAAEDDNKAVAGIQHYGNLCDPDFDESGFVNIIDFNEWRRWTGKTVQQGAPAYIDLDGNGTVWIQDFNIWRKFYGKAPGPGVGD